MWRRYGPWGPFDGKTEKHTRTKKVLKYLSRNDYYVGELCMHALITKRLNI